MHLKGYFSSRHRAAFSPLCITTIMAAAAFKDIEAPTNILTSLSLRLTKNIYSFLCKEDLAADATNLDFPNGVDNGSYGAIMKNRKKRNYL